MSTEVVSVTSKPIISRWSIPFAGFLFTLMGGIAYAWGAFIVPLEARFGWSRVEAALPLSIYLAMYAIVGMFYGGILQDKFGPRKIAIAGGFLFLIGYLLAAQLAIFPSVWWLILTFGIICGLGCGLSYSVAIPTARKWFPDKAALAISISLVGFGIAATIFAPWVTQLIANVGIENTFIVLGLVTSLVTFFASWLIRNPEPGFTPPGWEAETSTADNMFVSRTESTLTESLKTTEFSMLWLGLFCIQFGGLLAMAHMTPYGLSIIGLDKATAALAMVFFALTNGLGRAVAGWLAQMIGPLKVMLVTYAITAVTFFIFNTVATSAIILYICALIFGWGFAVTLGLFPVLTTISFGSKNLGAIYGAIFTAFGIGALLGPIVGAWLFDVTKAYVLPFSIAGIFTVIGWLICLFAFKLKFKLP